MSNKFLKAKKYKEIKMDEQNIMSKYNLLWEYVKNNGN